MPDPMFSATSWGQNRLDLFAIGLNDGKMYHLAFDRSGGGWQAAWEPLGGIFAQVVGFSKEPSVPAAVTGSPGRLDAFCIGASEVDSSPDLLQHLAWTDNVNGWQSSWENIAAGAANFTSPITAVAWAPTALEIFSGPTTLDQTPVIHQTSWTSNGWVQRPPIALPSGLTGIGSLSVVSSIQPGQPPSSPTSRLDLFAIGSDGAMYHWSTADAVTWFADDVSLGNPAGTLLSDQSPVVSWASGRLDVFATSAPTPNGSTVFHNSWQEGFPWGGWEALPFPTGVISAPAAVSWGPKDLHVFAMDINDNLQQVSWESGPAHQWLVGKNLGPVGSGAIALSWGAGRIDLLTMETLSAGLIQHIAFDNGQWQPAWETLSSEALVNAASGPNAGNNTGTFSIGFFSTSDHA